MSYVSVVRKHEIAWCAGLFDAEGCTTGRGSALRVAISQKAMGSSNDLLERFLIALGVGHIRGPYDETNVLVWTASGTKAVAAMHKLWSHRSEPKLQQFLAHTHEEQRIAACSTTDAAADMEADVAWAAGFFDGDGCTSLQRRKLRLGDRYKISMSIGQASSVGVPSTLERFRRVVDGGRIKGPYARGPGRKPMYQWCVSDRAAVARIGALLWPHLGLAKRQQLRSCRQQIDTLPPPHHIGRPAWRNTTCLRGHDHSDAYEFDLMRNGRLVHVRQCRPCNRERRTRSRDSS